MLAILLATFVANISDGNSLTLPAQRHLVNIGGTYLFAVQQGGADGHGLGFYRSDDGGGSWGYYAPIQDDASEHDTADLVAIGNDIALVWSYEGPQYAGSNVWYQRWRSTGGDWAPDSAVQVFGGSYQRAELAVDSQGRIWVQAFSTGGEAVIAVSTDDGGSFSQQPSLAWTSARGGGRLLSLGGRLMFLWGSHGCCDPGRMRLRDDSDPLDTWGDTSDVFGDGIYHGAALSAVSDGNGGVHLAYKNLSERLYYRHFDGSSWSDPQLVEGNSDWALQPAITRVGDGAVICYNHPINTNTEYQFWSRRVSGGSLSDATVLDESGGFKGYPASPEADSPLCGYGSTPDASTGGYLNLVYGAY